MSTYSPFRNLLRFPDSLSDDVRDDDEFDDWDDDDYYWDDDEDDGTDPWDD